MIWLKDHKAIKLHGNDVIGLSGYKVIRLYAYIGITL